MKKLALLTLSAIFLSGCVTGGVSPQKAEEISAKFISILAPGTEIKIKSVESAAGGDFKVIVDANGQEVISYLSPDGTTFYPQGLNIAELTKQFEEFEKQKADTAGTPPSENEEMIPVEGENGIGDGAEALEDVSGGEEKPVVETTEEVVETATE